MPRSTALRSILRSLGCAALLLSAGCSDQGITDVEPDFMLDTSDRSFGSHPVGCETEPLAFTVSNPGDAELLFTVGAINSVDDAFFFAGDAGAGDHSLSPTGSLTFEVVFLPRHAGSATGAISVEPLNDPDPDEGRTIDLDGTGQGDADGDGLAAECGDCDDGDSAAHPDAEEACDGLDNNCDDELPTDEEDGDGDGWMACDGDCDDGDALLTPDDADGDGQSSCDGDCDDGDATLNLIDMDGDGVDSCSGDCDDGDPAILPGAEEICDGIDNDCDGALDDETDGDGDGASACEGDCDDGDSALNLLDLDGDGVDSCSGDCDETDALVHPGAAELCDGIDNDCDGVVPADETDGDGDGVSGCGGDCDDADPFNFPGNLEICDGLDNDCDGAPFPGEDVDADGDGSPACVDCNDGNADVYPGATELCDGLDDDCDGVIPADETTDLDGDGFVQCEDCHDSNPTVYPGADEVCDGVDNDCDGVLPPLELVDDDGDGHPVCADCDETDPAIYEGAPEICDGIDNNCDGLADDDDLDDVVGQGIWYRDHDGDEYGDAALAQLACDAPAGFVADGTDCDDLDGGNYPGNTEVCDGADNDCDGAPSGDEVDDDGDGVTECDGDCDDGDGANFPGNAEVCDGADNDCDGALGGDEIDDDGDGVTECDDDCDDGDPANFPGNVEVCDDQDNDCDGALDGDEIDDDADGVTECDGDCDDGDAANFPGNDEVCDGGDNDCDGVGDPMDGAAEDCPAVDCEDVMAYYPGADGIYWIDPLGTSVGYEAYCDLTLEDGGWTLALTTSDDAVATWTWTQRLLMSSDTTLVGDVSLSNEDFKSQAHHDIYFFDLLFVHQPSGITAEYEVVSDGSVALADFIGAIDSPNCDLAMAGNSHELSGGSLTLGGNMCDTDLYFNLGDHESGEAYCLDLNSTWNHATYGPVWSMGNNNGCPFDDPSGGGFGPTNPCPSCDAGTEDTENTNRGYAGTLGLNTGIAEEAENYMQMYVR